MITERMFEKGEDKSMEEYFVERAGSYMRYQVFPGEGTPILFIHGLGCAGSFDYPQVAAQKELIGHERILVDLLGAGYSDKPKEFDYSVSSHAAYLKEFVDYLKLKEIIIFGHSLGGAVAIELADMSKDRVRALILAEANLDPSKEGATSYEITRVSEKDFMKTSYRLLLETCKKSGNTMWAATLTNWEPYAAYRFSESALRGGNPSWRQCLYRLPIKKSFIYGEKSLPDKDWEELESRGIHLEIVAGAGHSMAWENPDGLAMAIADCIKGMQ